MVDIRKEIDSKIVSESFSAKKPHIFNDDKTTFKQLKQLFTDVFDTRMITFSKKVPKIDAYLTVKDGNWFVSSYLRPEQQLPIGNAAKLHEGEEDAANAVQSTFKCIADQLGSIDQVLLNRFFANGNNRLHVMLVCPPDGCSKLYNDKCFAQFDGIDCFNGKKKAGRDEKSSFEIYKILKACPELQNSLAEITPEQLRAIKLCFDERTTLKQLVKRLSKLVDGIGWGCTIRDYVQDRYSRYLVNKALEYDLDVSKNGSLVNELTSRLSGTSPLRPTKSDLATFAKREGIDVKSDAYKEFLNDIEEHASQTNADIMLPIENAIYYAMSCAANIVLGYAALNPDPKAKKVAQQVVDGLFAVCSSIEDCQFDSSKLDQMKKALAKVCAYKDIAPKEVRIMNNSTPYTVACDCGKLDKISSIIA